MPQPAHVFCWSECITTDVERVKAFYHGLFGWQAQDKPASRTQHYSLFSQQGALVGAALAMPPELAKQGVPSHWAHFISTPDLDATLAQVNQAGGSILKPAFEVLDAGRMALILDPAGCPLSLWQAGSETGFGAFRPGQSGAPCWFELMSNQTDSARSFYQTLFGWEPVAMDLAELDYWLFLADRVPVAGLMGLQPHMGKQPDHWLMYFNSSNVDADAAKAVSLGGTVMLEPQNMSVGRFTLLSDPEGAIFGLLWMPSDPLPPALP